MNKKIQSIQAFDVPIGMGYAYIEPLPTFHPPSLPKSPESKATKLMQRLLKQEEQKIKEFRNRLLLKQPKTVMPMVQVTAIDPTPLNLPPLFHASATKKIKPLILYNISRSKTSARRKKR